MGKNYAIMGASGQIGRVVAEQLLEKGHTVKAIGRDSKKLDVLKKRGAEVVLINKFDDREMLASACRGAEAIFALIPPGLQEENYAHFQDRVGEAIQTAIQKNSIPYVVNLSSLGGHLAEGTGPIKGLHRQEERLNRIANCQILHLRPPFFMENLLRNISQIQKIGRLKTPILPNVALPMLSTDDIGLIAAHVLNQLNFKGKAAFELAGPREKPLNMKEVTKILGAAIGKPALEYESQNEEEARKEMLALGFKPLNVDLMLEMYRAFNEGRITFTQEIASEQRGKMTIEQFAQKFAQAYRQTEKQNAMA